MSKLYLQAPSEAEVSATYKGMTFPEFKLLEDEAIERLRIQAREEFHELLNGSGEMDSMFEEWRVFYDFCEWRRGGVPDRDMTKDEFLERVRHDIDMRRANDPEYGILSEADYDHLNATEREFIGFVIDEMWHSGTGYTDRPFVERAGNESDMAEQLGVTYDDLVEKGVLETYTEPADIICDQSVGYILAGRFADYVLVEAVQLAESNSRL